MLDRIPLDVLEQDGRAAGAQHAVANLGHLQLRIDFDRDTLQFAEFFQLCDEIAQIMIFHDRDDTGSTCLTALCCYRAQMGVPVATRCRLSYCGYSRKVRIPYYRNKVTDMLAKMTSKNQLTLPKSITAAVDSPEYFEVEARNGQIVLTPVRIQRGDAVRAKLAELDLEEQDIADAVQWARQKPAARVARATKATRVTKAAARKK